MSPAHADADPPSALPRGTRLGEFEIRRVLGVGGFGIVYLAFDHALEREVAIKEYMPGSLAGRSPTTLEVSVLSQANAESFSMGLRSFVNEARLLARFDHPSLVKVHRYWEAHHTAYMAMPYYAGHNLQQTRRAMREPPDEAWLRAIVEPLLGALARLHREGVYHRDISPDNVLIEPDGRPVLLDFGAARRVIGDRSLALTAILKPAYAPIEQYGEAGAVKQGPWTDLYALGATVHFLLLGRAPPPATTRTVHDEMQPLALQALPGCSERFLRCIDWMLQPRPADRPQQVAELADALAGRSEPPLPAQDIPRTQTMRHGAPPPVPSPDAEAITARQDKPDAAAWAPTTVARPHIPGPSAVAPTPSPPPGAASSPAPDIWLDARDGTPPTVQTAAAPASAHAPDASADPQAAAPAGPIIEWLPPSQPPAAPPPPAGDAPVAPRRSAWRLPAALGIGVLVVAAAWLGLRSAPAPAPPVLSTPAAATSAPAELAAAPTATVPALPAAPAGLGSPGAIATAAPPADAARPIATGGTSAQKAAAVGTAPPTATPARAAAPAAATGASAAGTYRWPMLPPPLPATTTPGTTTAATAASQPAHAAPAHAAAPTPAPAPTAATGATPGQATPAAVAAGPAAAASRATAPPTAAPTPAPAPLPAPRATPHAEAEPDAEPMVMKARVLSPSERCEGRVLIARWACIERQCNRVAELRNHPECVKLRREAEQRNELR